MRTAFLTLPALLCSLVAATPHYPQHTLQTEEAYPSPTIPSRWRSLSNHLLESLLGFSGVRQDRAKSDASHRQIPPAQTFAQYGEDLVLRFNISTAEESKSLVEVADTLILDVWEFSHDWIDIRMHKDTVPLVLGLLPESLQRAHTPLLREEALARAIHENYQRHQPRPFQSAAPTVRRPFSLALDQTTSGGEANIFFADYQPFNVIEPWLRLLASLFTTHVRHVNIGLSYEGRNIPALRVGVHPTNSEDPNPPKRKTILVTGSLHAREWIGTATVNYIAYSLITGYGKQPTITNLLEKFDFVFIPTINPDGYVYTWETDRLWRKNRQQTGVRFCQGIDLDRAFGVEWTATDNPCSESYSGEEAFEATESKALANWAKNETANNSVEFVGFLDLHSYSQQILYPYSYSCTDTPPGLENLEELAAGLSKAIRMTHGHNYEVMPACEGNVAMSAGGTKRHILPRMETSGGSALDFFYREVGVKYAYQMKLRDRGTYGFLLPKENIVPTGKEIFNAVMYFGEFLSAQYDVAGSDDVKVGEEGKVEEQGDTAREDDTDDEWWVKIEDVIEPEPEPEEEADWNPDLKRRRRR
ncbi:unnamed protein product [Zymoseptoria tritici ST99CH_3D7]|uniref:Inactive metallocarboxypeptidase ECM14 n=1 Tax=Zymoseptoria tritici (strain ST99CH_3D7) TaxID=1276538 RepID=A0A1X7RN61_ZYMT9|nr:unnamed protein product [Zymoseptoria tritici ST99CH_3D7]